MKTLCNYDCEQCVIYKNKTCKGCSETNACPFGKKCFIAQYIENEGYENYKLFVKELVDEFNDLHIEGLPKIQELKPLNGFYVNLEYPMPNGKYIKLLDDDQLYLGTQIENELSNNENKTYFGLVASTSFLLVCEYNENVTNPKLVLYKRR
ncbi:MAG: DUF3795 domain-containing protein [Bacillota bacterium]|nr:DUF3795 domain-containing protein [Bacillota bacterium]